MYSGWAKAVRVQESEIHLMKEYLDGESLEDTRIEQFAVGEEVTFIREVMKDRTAFVEEIGKYSVRLVLPVLGYRITARRADLVA